MECYPLKGQRKYGRRRWIVGAIFPILDTVRTWRGLWKDKLQSRKQELLPTTPGDKTRLKKTNNLMNCWAETGVQTAFCPQPALQKKTTVLHHERFFYIVWNVVMKITSRYASSHEYPLEGCFSFLLHLPNRFTLIILYCTYQMHLTCHSMTDETSKPTTGTNSPSLFCWIKKKKRKEKSGARRSEAPV